jgi:predicted RNase H-like nuclease
LGIDVGGEQRKHLDVVVMDADRQIAAVGSRVPVQRLRHLIEDHRLDIVCVDGPPAWAPAGKRSRLAERELKLLGIQAYYTPDRVVGESNIFYAWMRNGMAAFRAADRSGFPTYRGGRLARSTIEVFPHASATVLAGCLAPARQTAAAKRAWRAAILRAAHVPTAQLRTLDQVDAALCALTGIMALDIGDPFAPGAPDEGRIVLPARVVPAAGYRRCVPTSATATQPLITFCACGCGAQTRVGREFRAGHDRRLMVQLRRAAADGERARAELERRGWT